MRLAAYFVIALFVFSLTAFPQTNVSGTISSNTSWTLSGSPYNVVGVVTVNSGVTLSVDSGVVVRFESNLSLNVSGTLNARYATFTSSKDTAGGAPAKGDWSYVQVGAWGASGSVSMDHCSIKYGGVSSFPSRNGSIYVYDGSLALTSSDISNSRNYGILFEGPTNILLEGTTISSCDWPVYYGGQGSLTFQGINVLTGNTHNGIYMGFSSNSNALVLDTISVPYVFGGAFTINQGASLTVAAGNIVKFGYYVALYVNGALIAEAAAPGETIFTAYTDDNNGGDTNGDGTATVPTSRYWHAIWFNDQSDDATSVLRHCRLMYGGIGDVGVVSTTSAGPTIDNCTFSSNYYGVMLTGVSNPVFTDNTIGSSVMTPIAMSFSCNPVFSGNTFSFSDNTYDAIGLLGGTLPADAYLPIRSVTSVPNVVYVLLAEVVVPAGRTLTIDPGVVIKSFSYWHRIVIQGKLIAQGTGSDRITLTSIKDDNAGGDTNKDGTQSSPNRYDWGGIVFEMSSDSASVIGHSRIRYGGQGGVGAITMYNASPTVSNCEIKDSEHGLVLFQSSQAKIVNDTIINSRYVPVALSVSANPVLSGLEFINAGWTALGIVGEPLGFSGTIPRRNVAGYTNITYVLLSNMTINNGTNVLVEPGVVIKMNDGTGWYINGGFRAVGTDAEGDVIFSSLRDDNVGNPSDTNGDGQSTAPGRGDWSMIRFQATSDDLYCLLRKVQLKFGGRDGWGVVTFTDAGGDVEASSIINSYWYGVRCEGNSTPTIDSVSIASCGYDPIAMSLMSDPNLTNITFAGNGTQGIRLLEGTLSSNAYLRKRDVAGINNIAYIIHGLNIAASAHLTIEPGVVIKSDVDGWSGIGVSGALTAEGTSDERIVFTSVRDDSKGGDTNNDGNATTPLPGYWFGLAFYASAMDSLNSLRHCDIRYAGSGAGAYTNWGNLQIANAGLTVDSCSIEHSSTSGIGIYGSATPDIRNTEVNNIAQTPVSMSLFSQPTFTNIFSQNVGYMALGIIPESYSVDATVPKRDFAGHTNITYMIFDYVNINSGTTITIPAGVVFKGGRIGVYGGLISQGTAAEPVVFTHVSDDTYGNPNDMQGNGFTLGSMQWGLTRIAFADVSDDASCSLRNTVIRYAEVAVNISQASPSLSNCRFDGDAWGVYLNGVSHPVIDSCVFHNLSYAPLYTSLVSYPSSTTDNILSGTTWKGIRLIDETLSQDYTLPRRDFGGIQNIPYIMGNYSIGSGAVLTIEPGVIVKFENNANLYVHRGLIAVGGTGPDSTIVFTSLRDDFYGGDTNADSTATSPWVEWWGSIQFLGESLDPLCQIDHCVLRYGGWYWSGRGAVYVNNASPTITNSSFMQNRNAVFVSGASNPVINYCDIYQSSEGGVYNADRTFNVDARYNWWGDNSGPQHASNPGGLGVMVTDSVSFIPFRTIGAQRPKMGDVSLNGSIQAYDGSLVLKYVADPLANPLSTTQQEVADVSGEAGITAYDASLILQYVVGKITTFPVEGSVVQPVTMPKSQGTLVSLGMPRDVDAQTIAVPVFLHGLDQAASLELAIDLVGDGYMVNNVIAGPAFDGMQVESSVAGSAIRIAAARTEYSRLEGVAAEIYLQKRSDSRTTARLEFGTVLVNECNVTDRSAGRAIGGTQLPDNFALLQNYPNPFNPSTTIEYRIPEGRAHVTISVFDMTGRCIATLVDEELDGGSYAITWNGTTDDGVQAASGTYYCRMTASGNRTFTEIRKMLLMK